MAIEKSDQKVAKEQKYMEEPIDWNEKIETQTIKTKEIELKYSCEYCP